MMCRVATAIVLAGLFSWRPAWAAEINPSSCFCLRHSSGQIQRGCEAVKFPGQPDTIARCRDPETGNLWLPTRITEEWSVIMEGEEGCEICQPDHRESVDVPRGEDEDREEVAQ